MARAKAVKGLVVGQGSINMARSVPLELQSNLHSYDPIVDEEIPQTASEVSMVKDQSRLIVVAQTHRERYCARNCARTPCSRRSTCETNYVLPQNYTVQDRQTLGQSLSL